MLQNKQKLSLPWDKVHVPELTLGGPTAPGAASASGLLTPGSQPRPTLPPSTPQSPLLSLASGPLTVLPRLIAPNLCLLTPQPDARCLPILPRLPALPAYPGPNSITPQLPLGCHGLPTGQPASLARKSLEVRAGPGSPTASRALHCARHIVGFVTVC